MDFGCILSHRVESYFFSMLGERIKKDFRDIMLQLDFFNLGVFKYFILEKYHYANVNANIKNCISCDMYVYTIF